jgi:5,10-methylenetetrahydromethanopterin reductase
MTLEITVRVPPCRPIPELVEFARHIEQMGFDRVSFPDSQLLWRDVWTVMTAVALTTTDLGLSVAVTNPMTRHPTVTASAARAVAEVAPGRVEVCIGAGDSALTHIGFAPVRTEQLSQAVQAIRGLLHGEEIPAPGKPWRLHDPLSLPVIVGASGPRNLALAGRFADGALIPGVAWERDISIVRDAAASAGRDPDALSFTMTRACVVSDNPERDSAVFKPMCLRLAQLGAAPMFAAAGYPVEVPPHDVSGGDLGHPQDWDAAVRTSSQWISDDAALWFARTRCLFGTSSEIVDQLMALERSGVRRVLLSHPGAFTLPIDLVERFGTQVLTQLPGREPAVASSPGARV